MFKRITIAVLVAAIWCSSFLFLQELLKPKYMEEIPEGAIIAEYYNETTPHNVLFVGDCEVYENFSPITLWQEYGLTSYIRGSAQQMIWQSYYLMEEMLERETPEVVVFNVLSMKYDQPQSEAYNRLNIDGMKLSPQKIKAAEASLTEGESVISYIFPLLRYHSRWNEIGSEDFEYLFNRDTKSHNGFLMRADVRAADSIPVSSPLADYTFGENSYKYLDKMTQLCKEKGVELVLVKAPSLYPEWYEQWDKQIEQYADKNDLLYINFNENIEEIGLDYTQDTYDMGLHLNLSGAEKLASYFGGILTENFKFKDYTTDEKVKSVWAKKVAAYDKMEQKQLESIEQYGNLDGFTNDSVEN